MTGWTRPDYVITWMRYFSRQYTGATKRGSPPRHQPRPRWEKIFSDAWALLGKSDATSIKAATGRGQSHSVRVLVLP